ncbi:MAG: hypothetical protein COB36_04945 [Alphaproteobacteria bacterium]|nr:MAG: hypothetical protein COB36_04945 [Alphaproteobacteria bacterium]
MRLLVAIIFILACGSTAAHAEYSFNEKTEYYSINQPDSGKLLSSISRLIKDDCETKYRVFACTTASHTITYDPKKVGMGICRIGNLKLITNVVYRIPVWKHKKEASPEVQQQWNALFKHSIVHEKKHGEIKSKHMKIAYKKLIRLEARCSRIKREANDIIERAYFKIRRDNKRLDSRENHSPSKFPNNDVSHQ